MSEQPISVTNLNDFIFCPASIYFHALDEDEDTEKMTYQNTDQLNGSAAHEKTDTAAYSTKRSMLQGISVYCERYNLIGKIDLFDTEKKILTERKKKITTIYDGYVFQLYAQYYALREMGYRVDAIRLYSMDDNKTYEVELPEKSPEMKKRFEETVTQFESFSLEGFRQMNPLKCARCIYEPLCPYSPEKEEDDDIGS